MFLILTINPGSTSTKIAIFSFDGLICQKNERLQKIIEENISHDPEKMNKCGKNIIKQLDLRVECIECFISSFMDQNKFSNFDCIVSRGGITRPIESGSYAITDKLIFDFENNVYGAHASNLGALIAKKLRKKYDCQIMIADPVSVDELEPLARYTGLPEIKRSAMGHILNIKSTIRHFCVEYKQNYHDLNLIVVHIGGGISIVPIRNGKIIDMNNALDGGPFTPQRSGTMPTTKLVELAFSGKYKSAAELNYKLTRKSGLLAHLGTDDGKAIVEKINNGNMEFREVFEAMAYQIAKEIGSMATVLSGVVNAILITGGLSRCSMLINWISERIKWIAKIYVYPGEKELEALAEAGVRFLTGEEKLKNY